VHGQKKATRNSGTAVAVDEVEAGEKVGKITTRMGSKTAEIPAKIAVKSVFEVDNERLGIGVFDRPLLDREMRRFRAAWEKSLPEGLEAYEVGEMRISFVAQPEGVPAAWDQIDSLLAAATGKSGKAKKVA
jgi:hypothetical protein